MTVPDDSTPDAAEPGVSGASTSRPAIETPATELPGAGPAGPAPGGGGPAGDGQAAMPPSGMAMHSRRRAFLGTAIGAALVGGAAAAGYGYRASRPEAATQQRAQAQLTADNLGTLPAAPFHGRYQPGIAQLPQRQSAVIAFNVTAAGKAELTDLMRAITDRARFLTAGGIPPPVGITQPPSDSGVLGPTVVPDGLTVTVGVGSSLFDDRYGLADRRPARLTPMLPFPNDALDPAQCGGDLIVQLSAGNSDVVMHALRDIAKHTRGGMAVLWRIDGFISPARPAGT